MIIDDERKILKSLYDWLGKFEEYLIGLSINKDEESLMELHKYLKETDKLIIFFDKHIHKIQNEIHERSRDADLKNYGEKYLATWTDIKPLMMDILNKKPTQSVNEKLREDIEKLKDTLTHLRELIPRHQTVLELNTDK